MYDESRVGAMRQELVDAGFQELKTSSEVDSAIKDSAGTMICVVNSVCGCAAGGMRPGVRLSLQGEKVPTKLVTVFAGQDKEATECARTYFEGYAPSSPAVALFRDGKILDLLARKDIEGSSPTQIASKLKDMYAKHF